MFERYPELRVLYLKHLRRYGIRTAAAAHIRASLTQIEGYRKRFADFAEAEQQVMDAHKADIEDAIRERAIEGIEEPRFGPGGMLVGVVRRYSDSLLLAYAKRHIPEYREQTTTTTQGKVEHEHKHQVEFDFGKLTDEQRAAMRLLLTSEDEPQQSRITVEPANPVDNSDFEE